MEQNTSKGLFGVSLAELKELFTVKGNPEGKTKTLLTFVGLIFSPITLLGCLIFYKRSFRIFMEPNNELPRLSNLPPIVQVGMILGAILIWGIIYIIAQIMVRVIIWVGGDTMTYHPDFIPVFLGVNVLFTLFVWLWFSRWRGGIYKYISEKQRHGSARIANEKELSPYRKPEGFYIGFDTFYRKAGHLLTITGT